MKLLILLLLLTPLDEKKKVRVTCPLDGHKFTATRILRTNDWGGVDKDFCRHAYKTRPINYYVWVCPKCFFAGKKKDFDEELSDETKEKLRGKLKPLEPIRKGRKQEAIPGYVKYDLLAQVKTLSAAPPLEIGKAWLSAGWTLRDEGAIFLEDFDEWERVWSSYRLDRLPLQLGKRNRADYDFEIARKVEKKLEERRYKTLDRMLRLYLVAYLYRKHGELIPALAPIAKLDASRGENSVIDDAVAKMKKTIEREQGFLRRALPHFEKALESGRLAPTTKGEIAYVQGEIHRRLGDNVKARAAYDLALKTSPSKSLQQLATDQRATLSP